jgi:hypothetical protein
MMDAPMPGPRLRSTLGGDRDPAGPPMGHGGGPPRALSLAEREQMRHMEVGGLLLRCRRLPPPPALCCRARTLCSPCS